MPRPRLVMIVLALAACAAAGTPAAADRRPHPDADDQGDFWGAMVAPHAAEVSSLVDTARTLVDIAHRAGEARGDRAYQALRLREASALAARVRSLDPRAAALDYLLGIIADESGRAATATTHLQAFVERSTAGAQRIDALLRLGRIALVRREPAAAIAPLRRALAEQRGRGDRTRALILLATALDEAGDLDAAIGLLAGAIDRSAGPGEAEDNAVWLALVAAYDRDEQVSASLELVERLKLVLGTDYQLRLTTVLDDYAPAPAASQAYLRALVHETADQLVPARAAWITYLGLGDAARHRARAQAHVDAIDAALAARRAPPAVPRRYRRSP